MQISTQISACLVLYFHSFAVKKTKCSWMHVWGTLLCWVSGLGFLLRSFNECEWNESVSEWGKASQSPSLCHIIPAFYYCWIISEYFAL